MIENVKSILEITLRNYRFLIIALIIVFHGCCSLEILNLDYKGEKIGYILIDDAEEAVIINETVKDIETISVKNDSLFFKLRDSVLNDLIKVGYNPAPYNPEKLFKKVVRLYVDTTKVNTSKILDDLTKHNIQYLNKEKDYWLVIGNIQNLKKLALQDYVLQVQKGGVFPKVISISVGNHNEVERINSVGVDIHGVTTEDNGFLIICGAYDFQMEKIRSMGYKIN